MTVEQKIEAAKAALQKIIDEAKRDPKQNPDNLSQIAREALERIHGKT